MYTRGITWLHKVKTIGISRNVWSWRDFVDSTDQCLVSFGMPGCAHRKRRRGDSYIRLATAYLSWLRSSANSRGPCFHRDLQISWALARVLIQLHIRKEKERKKRERTHSLDPAACIRSESRTRGLQRLRQGPLSFSLSLCCLATFGGEAAAGEDQREIGPRRRPPIRGPNLRAAQSNLRNSIPRNSCSFSSSRVSSSYAFAFYSSSSSYVSHPILLPLLVIFILPLLLFACHFTHLLLVYAHKKPLASWIPRFFHSLLCGPSPCTPFTSPLALCHCVFKIKYRGWLHTYHTIKTYFLPDLQSIHFRPFWVNVRKIPEKPSIKCTMFNLCMCSSRALYSVMKKFKGPFYTELKRQGSEIHVVVVW